MSNPGTANRPSTAPLRRPPAAQTFRVRIRGQSLRPYDDLYHFLLVRKWWQFFAMAAAFYVGACALFALLYLLQDGSIQNARPGSFEDAFFFSVETMSTVGYGLLAPATRWAHVLVTVQAVVNILLVALFTGLTFAKFSRPTARVLFTQRPVVSLRNGVPHLMVRMANFRHNQVVEAQIRMYLLVTETTREGDVMRRPVDLGLVRERSPIFLLTFTAMHPLDESSPLRDRAEFERLANGKADLIVSFSGLDETLGQTIHARMGYPLADVVWNAHYENVLKVEPDGTREIDYTHFDDIVAEDPPG